MAKTLRAILFFGLISIAINFIKSMLFVKFDIMRFLNWDFLLYNVLLEFGALVMAALATHSIIKKISKDNLGIILLKALIFGILYGIISLIYTAIYWVVVASELEIPFDLYDSFVKIIPSGFTEGILYLLVAHYLNPTKRVVAENT